VHKRIVKTSQIIILIICFVNTVLLTAYFYPIYKIKKTKIFLYIAILIATGIITLIFSGLINQKIALFFHYKKSSSISIEFVFMHLLIAANEEITKVLLAIAIFFLTDFIERPFDFIFFCIAGAIGFAFIESYEYALRYKFYIQTFRFLDHIAFSVIFGFYFSLFIYYKKFSRKYDRSIISERLKASEYEIISLRYFVLSLLFPVIFHGMHNIIINFCFSYPLYFTYNFILYSFAIKKLPTENEKVIGMKKKQTIGVGIVAFRDEINEKFKIRLENTKKIKDDNIRNMIEMLDEIYKIIDKPVHI
jgi:RsiW-degrading membrane proteinase PrsW (M82 family)